MASARRVPTWMDEVGRVFRNGGFTEKKMDMFFPVYLDSSANTEKVPRGLEHRIQRRHAQRCHSTLAGCAHPIRDILLPARAR